MKSVAFVNQDALELSQHFEKRLAELGPAAGFIFVSVQGQPVVGGACSHYLITIGSERRFEESTTEEVVKKVFEREISNGWYGFSIRIVRGSRGSAGHQVVSGSNQASA